MTYLGVPSPLSVQYDQVIPLGLSTIDIISEEGTYVSLTQNGLAIDAGLTSSTGSISMDISGVVTMDSTFCCGYQTNKIPYMGSIHIMPQMVYSFQMLTMSLTKFMVTITEV